MIRSCRIDVGSLTFWPSGVNPASTFFGAHVDDSPIIVGGELRQAELESAMRQPGGIRLIEEQELHVVRRRLENFPEAMRAVLQAAHALRRPVTEVSADDVQSWATMIQPG